ncbi:uncharacterized protein DUF1131 [Roseibium hamelinense]|uniref:Uncharacterized protein DUF1131 n=1 Tax=Roseibium hamelinense TaxID=150831 RepID=A0A562TI60_9HYPH|nr:DUF1131 family protein [Roseibium hamelinense]MTI42605.1 DUF1131 family protein [Roseibium hamelinense]TWI93351.1 uncharacterized protein DUF1131 [Roseibium hamelinense]
MRPLLVPILCAVSFFAAACSPTFDDQEPLGFARTSDVTLVQITEDSVGGITKDMSYSNSSVEAALPGFTADGIQTAVEDTTEWAIAAFNSDGFQVLQVFKGKDGKVRTVHGVTHHLQGPNGERIGMTFSEVGTRRGDCRVGRNLWRGMAICKAKGARNVELVYAIPQYDGPFDQLPPNEELRGAMIQRILWTPEA